MDNNINFKTTENVPQITPPNVRSKDQAEQSIEKNAEQSVINRNPQQLRATNTVAKHLTNLVSRIQSAFSGARVAIINSEFVKKLKEAFAPLKNSFTKTASSELTPAEKKRAKTIDAVVKLIKDRNEDMSKDNKTPEKLIEKLREAIR